MVRHNLVVVFGVFLVCFLGSVKVSYATIHLAHGHFANAHFNVPCAGKSIGQACPGGALYAGTGYSSGGMNPALHYMVTPGGCTDESCTGAGGTDSVTKQWANGSGTTAYIVNTGARDLNNGKSNTSILVTNYTDTDAAKWCTNMNYGGYTDWYLPAQNELNYVLYANKAALGGFVSPWYWSSTELNTYLAWVQFFFDGGQNNLDKTDSKVVRCVRRY